MNEKKYRRKRWKMFCPQCERVMKFITPKGMNPPFVWSNWEDDLGHKAVNPL